MGVEGFLHFLQATLMLGSLHFLSTFPKLRGHTSVITAPQECLHLPWPQGRGCDPVSPKTGERACSATQLLWHGRGHPKVPQDTGGGGVFISPYPGSVWM